jgi:hypothetical protein
MNVLVLRPPGNGSKYHSQFDDVIGQLLGRPGLDVTLLERLPAPGESTTERLALESLGGHIACLAWTDAESTLGELDAAGKPMVRRTHKHDPEVPSNGVESQSGNVVGRLFFFDMRLSDANRWIFEELQQLLKTLQTPMFQIGAGDLKPSRKAIPPTTPKANSTPDSLPESSLTKPSSATVTRETLNNSPTKVNEDPPSDFSSSDDEDLDRLVDELDEMDL